MFAKLRLWQIFSSQNLCVKTFFEYSEFSFKHLGKTLRWSRFERISNQFSSNFSNYFSPFESIESTIWKIWFHPIVGIEKNEFWINFHRIFQIFFALSNQSNRKFSNWIERISNEYQFDFNPRKTRPSCNWLIYSIMRGLWVDIYYCISG